MKPGIKKGMKQTRQLTYDEMKICGKKFELARLSIGLNRKQMSEEVGVSVWTWRRWEKGLSIPHTNIEYIETRILNIINKYKEKISI